MNTHAGQILPVGRFVSILITNFNVFRMDSFKRWLQMCHANDLNILCHIQKSFAELEILKICQIPLYLASQWSFVNCKASHILEHTVSVGFYRSTLHTFILYVGDVKSALLNQKFMFLIASGNNQTYFRKFGRYTYFITLQKITPSFHGVNNIFKQLFYC